jgi:hypothetical protein
MAVGSELEERALPVEKVSCLSLLCVAVWCGLVLFKLNVAMLIVCLALCHRCHSCCAANLDQTGHCCMVEHHLCMVLSPCGICSCTFELHERMLCPSTASAHMTFAHDVQLLSLRVQSMECSELWQQHCLAVLTLYLSSVGVVHRWKSRRLVRVCTSEGACRSAAGGPHSAL